MQILISTVCMEYCYVPSNPHRYFPSSPAYWTETFCLVASDLSSVPSVDDWNDDIYEMVRSYHHAYTRIRGIKWRVVQGEPGGSFTNIVNQGLFKWRKSTPTTYEKGNSDLGLLFPGTTYPNTLPTPPCIALRLRYELDSYPNGRFVYHYIRNVSYRLVYSFAGGNTGTNRERTHLPYVGLRHEAESCWYDWHLIDPNKIAPLFTGINGYYQCKFGKRKPGYWFSLVTDWIEPIQVQSSRFFTRRTDPF